MVVAWRFKADVAHFARYGLPLYRSSALPDKPGTSPPSTPAHAAKIANCAWDCKKKASFLGPTPLT